MTKTFTVAAVFAATVFSAQISDSQLDQTIQRALKTFDVPGISVGVLDHGKLVYAKGFGTRSLRSGLPMDADTQVGIASNSKGFTCVALAMLKDEGKLNWDDKVTQHLPDFRMYDPYVTQEITIRDLVTHRAGLGLGQGDLMFFPEGGAISTQQLIHNVRYLKPQHSFRSSMDYNNVLFIVAGEVIRKTSGLSWEDFIEKRILQPVGMYRSFASWNRVTPKQNIIEAHAPVDGKAVAIPHDWNETANPAGGIVSTVNDMAKWAQFLLKGGVTQEGKRLVSAEGFQQLWQINTPIPVQANSYYKTNFNGYGLGWFISDQLGKRQIQHSGGLIGTVTHFTLFPELELGIIVLTNQQSGNAFTSITNTVKDAYLRPESPRDWVSFLGERAAKNDQFVQEEKQKVISILNKKNVVAATAERIIGTYQDPWFGKINIFKNPKGQMRLECENSVRLKGDLLPYQGTSWVVRWDDRIYDADAFVNFQLNEEAKPVSLKMKAISSITDFSFDFQNLEAKKIK